MKKGRNVPRTKPTTRQRDKATRDTTKTADNYYSTNEGKALNPKTDKAAANSVISENKRMAFVINGMPLNNARNKADKLTEAGRRASAKKLPAKKK